MASLPLKYYNTYLRCLPIHLHISSISHTLIIFLQKVFLSSPRLSASSNIPRTFCVKHCRNPSNNSFSQQLNSFLFIPRLKYFHLFIADQQFHSIFQASLFCLGNISSSSRKLYISSALKGVNSSQSSFKQQWVYHYWVQLFSLLFCNSSVFPFLGHSCWYSSSYTVSKRWFYKAVFLKFSSVRKPGCYLFRFRRFPSLYFLDHLFYLLIHDYYIPISISL